MDMRKAARDPWVWGQLVLFVLVGLWAPLGPRWVNLGPLDAQLNRVDPYWLRLLGVVIASGGLAFTNWAARSLGAALTPGTEPLPGAPLVREGPYRYVRHPIYTGIVFVLAGWTLAWANWTLALVVWLAAACYFEGKARAEERWLMARHPAYTEYARWVRRRVVWTGGAAER
jgi:protein-S-isoprenylcysteine O-methyltransferase Ste14